MVLWYVFILKNNAAAWYNIQHFQRAAKKRRASYMCHMVINNRLDEKNTCPLTLAVSAKVLMIKDLHAAVIT